MPKSSKKRKNGEVVASKAPPAPLRVSARGQANQNASMLTALASDFQMLVKGVQGGFNEVNGEMQKTRAILGTVIEVLGIQDKVEAKIEADKKAAQQRAADEAKAGLEKLVTDGIAVPASEIAAGSLIVGHETDAEGNVIFPGRIQLQVGDNMKPEYREALVGKAVGATLKLADKTLEVTEIYNIDAERIAAINAEAQAKADAAATEHEKKQDEVEAAFSEPTDSK